MSTSPFDNSAQNYDEEFTRSPIGILQRQRVYKYLLPLLKKSKSLLEINCGTGHDAIQLAPLVKNVLATDVSENMIRVCREKVRVTPQANLIFEVQDTRQVHQYIQKKTDVLFSNFGGLNCLNKKELSDFAVNIATCINSNGHLVLVIMGKNCWLEDLWYWYQNDNRCHRRKQAKGVLTTINGSSFYTYYYSPQEIVELFSENFAVTKIRAVGVFIPPSYLNPLFKKHKWILALLAATENLFGGIPRLANYADHYLIVLNRK